MKQEKHIEKIVKQLLKEASVETPSSSFVSNVMNAVQVENEAAKSLQYKPLIPKYIWAILISVFIAMSIYTVQSISFSLKLDDMFLEKLKAINSINLLNKIHFSNLFTFSFIFFSILVIIQLTIIKNYFNRDELV